ncbi:hypothetical protein E4U42_007183 [Claviceps africana]|uniref:Uncharacterized protein n=1 Tax=Claviceps africana TaxID=83212 RepID=A0A8K0NF98_9HYPO|nr:hypothetical protein E4U42_007183 [Claviceps africana]
MASSHHHTAMENENENESPLSEMVLVLVLAIRDQAIRLSSPAKDTSCQPPRPGADHPLVALYRVYEHIVLDQWINIRNEFEAFWYHSDWAVSGIPDPRDPDPERYACVASITALLCLAFNRRIGLGLPRNAPPIFSRDMLDEWRTKEPRYETEPEWALAVPRLDVPLAIPHWDNKQRDFVPLDSFEDRRASAQFSKKNILIWQPHVHFA